MKVSREKFAENRERILEVASNLFREKGFDGVAVADIMKQAGLTHGGFYGHFESKEDLAAQASEAAMRKAATYWDGLAENMTDETLRSVVENYLTQRHRDNPGGGCMFSSLASEAARQTGPVRTAFTNGLKPALDALEKIAPGRTRAARRRKAIAIMAEMIGAMVMARAVDDIDLSDEVLEATLQDLTQMGNVR